MSDNSDLPLLDMIVLSVLLIAILRGVWIGLIKEGSSLAAIGVATIVTRLFIDPVAIQLSEVTGGEIPVKTGVWIPRILLGLATDPAPLRAHSLARTDASFRQTALFPRNVDARRRASDVDR